MNLYNSPDPAKAELDLAAAWAKSAKREGHRQSLPSIATKNSGRPGSHAKAGVMDAVRKYTKNATGTFTRADVCEKLKKFKPKQIGTALQSAAAEGVIFAIGKNDKGMNIYRSTSA